MQTAKALILSTSVTFCNCSLRFFLIRKGLSDKKALSLTKEECGSSIHIYRIS